MIRTLSALAVLALASPASAYLTQNNLHVTQVSESQFMVTASPGMGAPSSWCAAGDFAIRRLHVAPNTPIWRISEPPRPRGEGVLFSLSPEGAASRSGLLRLNETDASVSAGFAQELCWDPKIND
jgi:hypothetical protein